MRSAPNGRSSMDFDLCHLGSDRFLRDRSRDHAFPAGRFAALRRGRRRRHRSRSPQRASGPPAFCEAYGAKIIIIARFVPIVRTFTPFLKGRNRIFWSNGATSERGSLDSLKVSIVPEETTGGIFIVAERDPVLGPATAVGLDASAIAWITPGMLQERKAVSYSGIQFSAGSHGAASPAVKVSKHCQTLPSPSDTTSAFG